MEGWVLRGIEGSYLLREFFLESGFFRVMGFIWGDFSFLSLSETFIYLIYSSNFYLNLQRSYSSAFFSPHSPSPSPSLSNGKDNQEYPHSSNDSPKRSSFRTKILINRSIQRSSYLRFKKTRKNVIFCIEYLFYQIKYLTIIINKPCNDLIIKNITSHLPESVAGPQPTDQPTRFVIETSITIDFTTLQAA